VGSLTSVSPADVAVAPPSGVTLPVGTISFKVTGVTPGTAVPVGLITTSTASQYWRYGPRLAGQAPQWYQWAYDPAVPSGAQADAPGRWTLWFVDGAPGDDDGAANGVIVDPGGPADSTLPPPPPPVASVTLHASSGSASVGSYIALTTSTANAGRHFLVIITDKSTHKTIAVCTPCRNCKVWVRSTKPGTHTYVAALYTIDEKHKRIVAALSHVVTVTWKAKPPKRPGKRVS
jgi:hypothetical protein